MFNKTINTINGDKKFANKKNSICNKWKQEKTHRCQHNKYTTMQVHKTISMYNPKNSYIFAELRVSEILWKQ